MPLADPKTSARFCIDLFAGAGGLSLGLERAGFVPVLAVEKSAMAAETYFRNILARGGDNGRRWEEHITPLDDEDDPLVRQIMHGLAVAETSNVLGKLPVVRDRIDQIRHEHAMPPGELDLIAGGPPCQGFSLAGLRDPKDRRNSLPYEFLQFVAELQPKSVLIENVTGIGLAFSRNGAGGAVLPDLVEALRRYGYRAQIWRLNARHFGVAQNRPRIMIAAVRLDLLVAAGVDRGTWAREWTSSLRAPDETASWLDDGLRIEPTDARDSAEVPASAVLHDLVQHSTSAEQVPAGLYPQADALRDLPMGVAPPNHSLRHHGARTTARFHLARYFAARDLPENLFHTAARPDGTARITREIGGVTAQDAPMGIETSAALVAAGIDPSGSLVDMVVKLATRKHSQRPLRPNAPAPTMMSLPDDHIHYAEPRTLTVREMARIQSFPDSFEFFGKETTGADRRRFEVPQYTQVGNAVPPRLAEAIGHHLFEYLDRLDEASSRNSGRS